MFYDVYDCGLGRLIYQKSLQRQNHRVGLLSKRKRTANTCLCNYDKSYTYHSKLNEELVATIRDFKKYTPKSMINAQADKGKHRQKKRMDAKQIETNHFSGRKNKLYP